MALSAWGILNLTSPDTTAYEPRPVRPAAQPDGAREIRNMLLADADGNIDHAGLQQLRRSVVKTAEKQRLEKANSLSWQELGPDNIGGRTGHCARGQQHPLCWRCVRGTLEVDEPWRQLDPNAHVPEFDGGVHGRFR